MSLKISNRDSELLAVLEEARAISNQPELSKRDEARINVLLAKASALKTVAPIANDRTYRWFKAVCAGQRPAPELINHGSEERANTDMLAGQQSITYSAATAGGTLVPTEFANAVVIAAAQYDPLLDADVVSLNQSRNFQLRPWLVPGWDLTTFAAVRIAEGAQQTPQAPPNTAQAVLNSFTYRASLDASIEFEEDTFQPFVTSLGAAYGIAFARGIGADLAVGTGSGQPQGVLTGATDSGYTTANSGKLVYSDFTAIYFGVNRIYRAAKKCAWLMNDETYQLARNAVDDNHRPLINVVGDEEQILGKPVYVSPSLDNDASTAADKIVFGDLSRFFVRVSGLAVARSIQTPGQIEKGKALFIGRMRADSKVFDPSNGSVPPIVFATLHS